MAMEMGMGNGNGTHAPMKNEGTDPIVMSFFEPLSLSLLVYFYFPAIRASEFVQGLLPLISPFT